MDCPECSSKDKFFGEDGDQYCSHCGFHFADSVDELKRQLGVIIKRLGFEEKPYYRSMDKNASVFEKEDFGLCLKIWRKKEVGKDV